MKPRKQIHIVSPTSSPTSGAGSQVFKDKNNVAMDRMCDIPKALPQKKVVGGEGMKEVEKYLSKEGRAYLQEHGALPKAVVETVRGRDERMRDIQTPNSPALIPRLAEIAVGTMKMTPPLRYRYKKLHPIPRNISLDKVCVFFDKAS